MDEHASDLANLTCASDFAELSAVNSVPVIWQNCLYVDEHASDLAELPVPAIWQKSVSGQCASDFAELSVCGGVCQ